MSTNAPESWGPYRARVDAIHDGDTISLTIDLGFDHQIDSHGIDGTPRLSCRIYGINAPELSTQAGKDARAFIETLIKPGDLVQVRSYGWDKYGGRFDGSVLLASGSDLGELMVESGHAVVVQGRIAQLSAKHDRKIE